MRTPLRPSFISRQAGLNGVGHLGGFCGKSKRFGGSWLLNPIRTAKSRSIVPVSFASLPTRPFGLTLSKFIYFVPDRSRRFTARGIIWIKNNQRHWIHIWHLLEVISHLIRTDRYSVPFDFSVIKSYHVHCSKSRSAVAGLRPIWQEGRARATLQIFLVAATTDDQKKDKRGIISL
jgi:hypothetical protein